MRSALRLRFAAHARIVLLATILAAGASTLSPRPLLASAPLETTAGPDGHWFDLFGNWPVNVGGPTLYDPVRDRILLLGNDANVWELSLGDPLKWKLLPKPIGAIPAPYLAVYDPNADRVLAVSPRSWPDSVHVFQLTLSEPMTWSEFPSVGSPQNWLAAGVVFDPATNKIQIFGGSSPNPFGGPTLIVEWMSWISVATGTAMFTNFGSTGLVARTGFANVVDPARNRIVVYGGFDRFTNFHDVKTAPLGGTSFLTAATTGSPPVPVSGNAMVDATRDRMLFFCTNGPTSEIWQLTLAPPMTWSQVATSGPTPTTYGSAVYDPTRDRMVSYGPGGSDRLWALSLAGPETWTDHSLPHPNGVYGRVTINDEDSHRLVLHGDVSKNDVWALSLDGPAAWTKLVPTGAPPPNRDEHSGVYDSARDRLIIFAGHANFSTPPYNDVWALSLGSTPTWSAITPSGTPPPGRYWHTAIYDPIRDRMLVWGGTGSSNFTDLWELTLSGTPAWNLLTPVGPAPAYIQNSKSIYDPVRDRMLIVGGVFSGQTWALSLSGTLAWEQLPTCPGTDLGPVYDPVLDRVVALASDRRLYELPLANPTAWRQMATTGAGPSQVNGPALIFDQPGNRAVALPREGYATTFSVVFGDAVNVPASTKDSGITLGPGAPNPASTFSMIRLSVASHQPVVLEVFDMTGRRVRELVNRPLDAGEHWVRWDLRGEAGGRVAPGVYLYSLTAGGVRLNRRAVVVP